jgi:hypothetical protein
MAPCNFAIGFVRQAGHNKIAATIRKIKYDNRLTIGRPRPAKPIITGTKDFAGHPGAPLGARTVPLRRADVTALTAAAHEMLAAACTRSYGAFGGRLSG